MSTEKVGKPLHITQNTGVQAKYNETNNLLNDSQCNKCCLKELGKRDY